ncbi:MAG: hypothetical protein Q4G62_00605 [Pseudomonadota bacterium]|nr:hypothetical protein [Pseudomonadota bacterium]
MNIGNLRGIKREIEQEAYKFYEQHSGHQLARRPDGSYAAQGHNDELDAFRHAYTSGRVTQKTLGFQSVAKHFGDEHETGPANLNDPYEHRMDLWNNEVGRRLGAATSNKEDLATKAFESLRNGTLVTGLSDPRLRQLFADDPRLKLPQGDPARDLLTASDVGRINTDVEKMLDVRQQRFPDQHGDRTMFNHLRQRLPAHISDAKVAEVLLDAKQGGIEHAHHIDKVAIHGERILVMGQAPGFRSMTSLNDEPPAINQTLYDLNAHDRAAQQEQEARQRSNQQQHAIGGY